MKKLSTMIFCAALLAAAPITVFAETITSQKGSSSKEVIATYQDPTTPIGTVYSVDITWGSMAFTYKEPSVKWNPETHKYEGIPGDISGWFRPANADDKKVTVTNHSNAEITVSLVADMNEGITGEFYRNANVSDKVTSLTVATAVGTKRTEAPTEAAYLEISGDPIKETGKIGTLTVTLN